MVSLDRSQLDHILDQLIASRVMAVTITGGEPLLCQEPLIYAISRLTTAGIEVSLNSNLMLLDQRAAAELQQAGLRTIVASLLSWQKATHTRITRNPAAFDMTVRGIGQAVATGLHVAVNMVISRLNFDAIYRTAAFVRQLGATCFAATRVAVSSNNRQTDPFRLTREQVQASFDILEQIREEMGIAVESLACYPFCLLKDLERFRHLARRRCGAGKTTCTISARGAVRACSFADLTYGDIFTDDLRTIWQRMGEWRQVEHIDPDCQRCQWLSLCGGGCRMEARYSGNINGSDPYMQSPKTVGMLLQQRPVALVPVEQSLSPQTNLKLRVEPFGGIIYSQALGIVPVDHEYFSVLRRMPSHGSFTTAALAARGEASIEHLQQFFSWLVAQGFLTTDERG